MIEKICIVGGDMRQLQLAKLLAADGLGVECMMLPDAELNIKSLKNADVLILPIPVSRDDIYINAPLSNERIAARDILDAVSSDCLVLGACISEEIEGMLTRRGLRFSDYYAREELIIKNAIPTAEGALEIAMREMPITIFGSKALVIGYGRVGKVMARKLSALGADVTVSARKLCDFAWIEEAGMTAVHTNDLALCSGNFDLIINTVPSVVLTEDVLKQMSKNVLIIDLASKPGGVDMNAAKRLGVNVIWALSLPGKCAPVTSGKIVKEAITNIIAETGV